MADPYELERCLVSVAIRLAEKQYPSLSDFGRAVFPGKKSGYHTMLGLQKPTNPKLVSKPRTLKFCEAVAMAKALKMDLSDLITLAEKEAKLSNGGEIPEASGILGA